LSAAGAPFTALVLAGSRGAVDPVARHAGLPHKAFVPIAGTPMLHWVLAALRESPSVGRIAVCLDEPELLAGLPDSGPGDLGARIVAAPTGVTPGASVLRAIETLPDPWPLLVTTADHPLLTAAMVEHFCTGVPGDADVGVAVAPASLIRRSHPDSVRTFYRFAAEAYSGCNLFCLRTPAAKRAVAFWSRMERHRKRPWRLISAIGPVTLCRFLLGRLTLERAMERLSGLVGATVRAVEMPFAEAAMDVDKPSDLALAESILRRR